MTDIEENVPVAQSPDVLIARYLDEEGRLRQWPSKHTLKQAALAYLAGKFEYGRDYTEREVNEILMQWHTFGDYFILRRGLIEARLLSRVPNGSRYWKNQEEKEN